MAGLEKSVKYLLGAVNKEGKLPTSQNKGHEYNLHFMNFEHGTPPVILLLTQALELYPQMQDEILS